MPDHPTHAVAYHFETSTALLAGFLALVVLVLVQNVGLLVRAAPTGRRGKTATLTALAGLGWIAVHLAVARSGWLEAETMPPRVLAYLPPTLLIGVAVALSPVGGRLARLPLGLLVASQAFRLPLECWLHALHDAGPLPLQMTWSGMNFDVLTGLSALALGLFALRGPLPPRLVLAWNAMGVALLATVVGIAVLSAPTPLRQFTEGPPVVLPYHAPFNLIVSVHVWTALVGHLVVFRALSVRRAAGANAGAETTPP